MGQIILDEEGEAGSGGEGSQKRSRLAGRRLTEKDKVDREGRRCQKKRRLSRKRKLLEMEKAGREKQADGEEAD